MKKFLLLNFPTQQDVFELRFFMNYVLNNIIFVYILVRIQVYRPARKNGIIQIEADEVELCTGKS